MQSRNLGDIQGHNASSIAVYRDPYLALRKTANLFKTYPSLASCIRRIWFTGYHGLDTNTMIFSILRHCIDLDFLTLPWTALRYGDANDWASILGANANGHSISSLELLATDLKESQMSKAENHVNRHALDSSKVDFGGLRRLKVFGRSNYMPITDEDLIAIARTAVNLREIHITATAETPSFDGIASLMDSSAKTLEVLEHSPISVHRADHPTPAPKSYQNLHVCQTMVQYPRLRNIALTLPSICEELFSDCSVDWQGEMQIRIDTICGRDAASLGTSEEARAQLFHMFDKTRHLMISRSKEGVDLNVEVYIGSWIFEPRRSLVHGSLQLAELRSGGAWPHTKVASGKGFYGQSGLDDKEEGPCECVSEKEFREALNYRYIIL